jgi:hypothetical protein
MSANSSKELFKKTYELMGAPSINSELWSWSLEMSMELLMLG